MRDDGDTFTAHMQRAARLPRQNQNLRYLLIARVVILLSYVAAPFYSIYSINVLGAPVSIIGVYMGVRTIVALLINPVWSRLSDRRGNKIVMQLATAVGVVMLAWVVFMPGLARSLNVPAAVIAYAVVPVFALMGTYETGVGIGAVNLTLEVAPPNDRAIYIGLTNTILGVAYLSTAVSGLIVDAGRLRRRVCVRLDLVAGGFVGVVALARSARAGDRKESECRLRNRWHSFAAGAIWAPAWRCVCSARAGV